MAFSKAPDHSRAGGLLLALILAFTAQYIFTGEVFTHELNSETWSWQPNFSLGSALLLAALGCAAWATQRRGAFSKPDETAKTVLTDSGSGPIADRDFQRLAAAGACYGLALLVYSVFGETWLVQALWLLGIGLLAAPLFRSSTTGPALDRVVWWEWTLVIALTLAGFGVRYWNLTEIPSHIDQDVPFMGLYARELIQNANYNWVGVSGSGHLLSYDQSLAWSMRLFGQTQYGLIMRSVLLGTLTLPLIFLLGRELFGRRVGLIAMALLTFDYTSIHFSRIMFGPSATFFAVLVLYLLFRAWRRQQPMEFGAAGLAMGLGLLNYDSSRIIPVIVLAVLGWAWLWQRHAFHSQWRNWAVLALGGLVGFGPMLVFAVSHFDEFIGRGNVVMIWEPEILQHEMSAYQVNTLGQVLLEQTRHALLTFHLYGDGSPHFTFPRPMVAALVAALLVMGLGYCLTRARDARHFTLLAWLGLTLMLGGVLTYDPPYWPHLNIALPAVVLIAALAAEQILDKLSPTPDKFGYLTARLALVGVLAWTAVNNWETYYDYVKDNPGSKNMISRYVRTLPPGYEVYLLSSAFTWNESAFRFFNQGVPGENVTADQLQDLPPTLNKPIVFILYDDQDLASFLEDQYPGGKLEAHTNFENRTIFVSYEVAPQGYEFPPAADSFNLLNLPGWWLIAGLLVLSGGWLTYRSWQVRRVQHLQGVPNAVKKEIVEETTDD